MLTYPLYILLGLLPSLIWLCYYLKKDRHPESNAMVLKIFGWGMLMAPVAIVLELALIWLLDPRAGFQEVLAGATENTLFKAILAATLIPASVEELLKYLVVRQKVLRHSEFDEPLDAMLYCVIAGLGFAAIENLLVLLRGPLLPMGQAFTIISMRFLGATLVHALASALVGYFLAQSLLYLKKKGRKIIVGLALAIIFHSGYNYFIITIPRQSSFNQQLIIIALTVFLLIGVAFLVGFYFRKLKKEMGICQIRM